MEERSEGDEERERERGEGEMIVSSQQVGRGSESWEMDGVWCAPGQTLPAVCFILPIFLPRANRESSELQLSECESVCVRERVKLTSVAST